MIALLALKPHRLAAVLLAGALALASCSGDAEPDAGASAPPPEAAPPPTAPADPNRPRATPARHLGPQGRVGQFVVHCDYSHSGDHDPIVHFGHEGRSHRHDFYGSDIIDSDTSAEDLLAGGTTCNKRVDKAGYWQPTLYDHGEVVEPTAINAYYRAAPGVEPTAVQTMPVGLALIAGDQTATEPQEGEAVGWVCGTQTRLRQEPPECPGTAPLRLVLTFQDCWDGEHLESADHQSHVAYSTDGACPTSHPVHIPQITMSIGFPITGPGHDLTLASGSIHSAHGDFLNAWEPEGLLREIEMCIHRDVVCNLSSNRAEDPLFTG